MKLETQLFASDRVRRIYFVYFAGAIIIVIALLFVVLSYQRLVRVQQNPVQLSDRAVSLAAAAQSLPPKQLHLVTKGPLRQGLHVQISKAPPPESTLINQGDLSGLREAIMNQPDQFDLSVQVADQRWLTLRHHLVTKPLLFYGFMLSSFVLLVAFAAWMFGLVRRLAYPLGGFVKAAQRFGIDIQAPPIAVTGPPELQQAIAAFNQMQAQVKQLVDDRTQMLAAISHDLRTPITRLKLRAEWMSDQKQQAKVLADLEEMQQMIDSILSFARDYSSQEALAKLDLNALLDTICDDLIDAGRDVRYQGLGRAPIQGRLLALKRALSNLIENAVKYGGQAQVELVRDGSQLQIKIKDQGPGIPESELKKVFLPFYRVDAARTSGAGGSGLGLAVARDIIRAHAGDIQLRNLKPAGLLVLVTLPLQVSTLSS